MLVRLLVQINILEIRHPNVRFQATWRRSGIDTVLKFVRHSGTTSLAAKHLLDFNDAVDDVVRCLNELFSLGNI